MTRKRAETIGVPKSVLKRRARMREYYHQNKKKMRENMYKYLYGIDLKQYGVMLERQKGVCSLCGKPPKAIKNHMTALVVDHDHETGKVRSLLCANCNRAVGLIEKDMKLAMKMMSYIDSHSQRMAKEA